MKLFPKCGQLMWSKALTLQYHSEPFESTPVAFLMIKTGESIKNISLQHEPTKIKEHMSNRQTSNGDKKKGNLVLYCDFSSALFSYTHTSLFHLNDHTTLLHPKT